jgi:hypothetical protein
VVATANSEPRSLAVEEVVSRGSSNRSQSLSVVPCVSDDDSLSMPEIRLHIAIEEVCHLKMAQETRSLSIEELSLVDFLLDQILSLKEVVAQHGGVVPHIVSELLCHKQVALLLRLDIPNHQPLMSLVCKLATVKTYPTRKLACTLSRCKA